MMATLGDMYRKAVRESFDIAVDKTVAALDAAYEDGRRAGLLEGLKLGEAIARTYMDYTIADAIRDSSN